MTIKRHTGGGNLGYWSRDRVAFFEFMQNLGVPRKADMLTVMSSILPFKKAQPRILEIGGGTGAFTKMIFRKYPRASLVFADGSPDMLRTAEKRLRRYKGRLTFLERDINDPGWHGGIRGSFDAVVSSWCLHYLSDGRQKPFFRETYGLLRPGGMFLFSCSVGTVSTRFLKLYNALEVARVKDCLLKQGMEVTEAQIRAMARTGHTKARINPAPFEVYCRCIEEAGFCAWECVWKYLFNAVFAACKGR